MWFWERFKKQFGNPGGRDGPAAEAQQPLGLTPRERDVFRLLLEGYTLQETADQLGVKYSTANTHMTAIYKKLGVNTRAELIIRYRDFGKEEPP
ncbi:MAG: LuxR family transcriptional regulator [Clostridia bacterium]|nr:LuxR family transcriptional regulator [Clostridia bacterium]